MKEKTFKRIKILTTSFVSAMVAIAVVVNNTLLAMAGVIIGILFLAMVRRKAGKVTVDERIKSISGEASRLTYVVVTVFLGVLSLLLTSGGNHSEQIYMEALGVVFSYIVLLSIAIYAMSYKFFEKKYGGDDK